MEVLPLMTERDAPVVKARGARHHGRSSTASRTMSSRPAPTTRSTLPASATSTTASPMAPAFSTSPTGPTNGSASRTWSKSAKVMAIGLDVLLRGRHDSAGQDHWPSAQKHSLAWRTARIAIYSAGKSRFYPPGFEHVEHIGSCTMKLWKILLAAAALALADRHLGMAARDRSGHRHSARAAASRSDRRRRRGDRRGPLRQRLRGPDPHRPDGEVAAGSRRKLDHLRRRQDLHLQAARPASNSTTARRSTPTT